MKKSLIACAALAVCGGAFAQSSVQVYGVADVWLGSVKNEVSVGGVKDSLRNTKLNSGGISGSRFGFKGSEDLGGGLKANFTLEQGFDIDNGSQAESGKMFNRDAWVGLSGGFGALKFGRSYTAYDDVRGTNNNTFDSALSATPWIPYAARGNNQIHFSTPDFGGVKAAVSYAFGENKTSTSGAGNTWAINVSYNAGPLNVAVAHQQEKAGSGSELGYLEFINNTLKDVDPTWIDITNNAGDKAKYTLLTAGYDFGSFKLLGSYNQVKLTFAGVPDNYKANEYQLGVEVPLGGALTFAAGYGQSKWKENGANLVKANAYSAALAYSMSKRTTAYTGFNYTKYKDNSGASSDYLKTNMVVVGLKHTF